ncbi:hypothetical protein [Anaeromyxobacter oryzae]|uniref:Uncharacterized protein n=1 Tax=Anaeromyxobacter oryzae TaxID=2918170 RepID=A0ABM7X1T2_9BACT|nr:hypothetical protein [Anaeromyxobacter oryzae]BDG05753.1 hypothetical protein AMOR_47490 [Anaeromyxobacter oryzae]
MPPSSPPLQSVLDPFVESFGGELVSGLVPTQHPQPEQADYLFREHGVIAELKALEVDSFGEAYSRKLGELTHDWMRRGLMLVYGRARIEMHRLHRICQNEWMEVLTEPLQKKVVAKANRQLRQTAELLNMPSAKGVLWVASDGNLDLQPHDVWRLIGRILRKKNEDGSRQYSSIDGVIYFNPRTPVRVPGSPDAGMLWVSHARDDDPALLAFFEALSNAWADHLRTKAAAQGQTFTQFASPPDMSAFRFYGSRPTLPRATASPKTK